MLVTKMPINRLLIDADYPAHRCAFSKQKEMAFVVCSESHDIQDNLLAKDAKSAYCQEIANGSFYLDKWYDPESEESCLEYLDDTLKNWCGRFGNEVSRVAVLGPEGKVFRHDLFADYKAGRGSKPIHHAACRRHLSQNHGAIWWDKMEADDVLGIMQCDNIALHGLDKSTTCIVTVDKDLDCIPGWHYDPIKDNLYQVSEEEADMNFMKQWLTGDTTDNIAGINGVGPAKADKIIGDAVSIDEGMQAIFNAYAKDEVKLAGSTMKKFLASDAKDAITIEVRERITLVGELVWIHRTKDTFFDLYGDRLAQMEYQG